MGIIKKLFGFFSEKEEPQEELVEQPIKEQPKSEVPQTGDVCEYCGLGIGGEQRSIKKNGKRYHVKPCWRNLQKDIKQMAFN